MSDFALVLVELRRIERRIAVQHEIRRRIALARIVRDLEIPDRRPAKQGQAAAVRKNIRDVSERPILARVVMNGIAGTGRVLHAEVVFKVAARDEVIEVAGVAMNRTAWLQSATTASIQAQITAILEGSALGLEVDHARGAIAVLRRQCAGQQIDRICDMGIEGRTEAGNAFRHDHAVEAILQVGVLVADVDRTVAVEGYAGCLDQHLSQTAVDASGLTFEDLAVNMIFAGAE